MENVSVVSLIYSWGSTFQDGKIIQDIHNVLHPVKFNFPPLPEQLENLPHTTAYGEMAANSIFCHLPQPHIFFIKQPMGTLWIKINGFCYKMCWT